MEDELDFLIGLTQFRSFEKVVCQKSAIGRKIKERIKILCDLEDKKKFAKAENTVAQQGEQE